VRAGAKPVRYVSLVRQVRLQNVVRVGFDAMKKVIISIESNRSATVGSSSESFGTTQKRFKTRAISSRTHSRPCWCRVLNPRKDCGTKNVMKWRDRRAVCAQHSHGVHQARTRRQQRGYVVDGRQLVIHGNAEDSQAGYALDVRSRRRWLARKPREAG